MSKLFRNVLICICVFLIQIPYAFAWYKDVVPQSLFYEAVQYFSYDVPILNQDKESFKPLHDVNRAEFYKILISSSNFIPSDGQYELPYNDIAGDEWFAPYIKKALDAGIIQFNNENPYFHPAQNISRAEGLDKILAYYQLDVPDSTFTNYDYIDVNKEDPFATISQIAFELELLHDYKSRTFYPDKNLTRAETVHILYKIHTSGLGLPLSSTAEPAEITGISSDITSHDSFYIFLDVWEKIIDDYVEKGQIDKNMLIYGAISGMVEELDDPYSAFFVPTEAQDFIGSLDGTLDGIGIYLSLENEQVTVITPIKGSPADKAGVKPNDVITEIDDEPVSGLSIVEVVDMIRGEIGTSVKLTIERDSGTITKTIERAHIDIPYVESEMRDGVGVIYYYQFSANSHDQFLSEIEKIKNENPKGLVLDLRNNPGGYLYSSQQLVSHFLENGEPFVKITFADGEVESLSSSGPADLKGYETVVLINEGSASASEILALALGENNSEIVGVNSYGKTKIQEIFTYNDGSSLKLSTAIWESAAGIEIDKNGITPDYRVELTEQDIANNRDPQLEKAIELLN
jgi:carboxyl-terminal processing protease